MKITGNIIKSLPWVQKPCCTSSGGRFEAVDFALDKQCGYHNVRGLLGYISGNKWDVSGELLILRPDHTCKTCNDEVSQGIKNVRWKLNSS